MRISIGYLLEKLTAEASNEKKMKQNEDNIETILLGYRVKYAKGDVRATN